MDPAFHLAIIAGITGLMIGQGSSNVVGGQFVFLKTHGRCIDHMIVLEPAAMKAAFGENPKEETCLYPSDIFEIVEPKKKGKS